MHLCHDHQLSHHWNYICLLPRYFIDFKDFFLITESCQLFGLTLSFEFPPSLEPHFSKRASASCWTFGRCPIHIGVGMLSLTAVTPSAAVVIFSVFRDIGTGLLYLPSMVVGSSGSQLPQ
ncbi:hypothetical protein C8F04DRAFT_464476 [Mycena alexandri]|uniref:Uncharacterized protein n=1 Tax=Mycena alexandri TaxID=1745969 RepID=A0AAD6T088_9AGAR|nr:hypothetical protein C8F04DRAFT_464476 [Mycena alexandri]